MSYTKNPYEIIKHRYITEKAVLLSQLKSAQSNPSLKKFNLPKYVFIVDRRANKQEIAEALEEIYKEKKIKVVKVNTINVKSKVKMSTRKRRPGKTAAVKKAIVTLEKDDQLDNV